MIFKAAKSAVLKLEQEYKEYSAGDSIELSLDDDYLYLYKKTDMHKYRIKFLSITSVYKDDARLCVTYNNKGGIIRSIDFGHDNTQKIDRFVQYFKTAVNSKHAKGIVS